MCSHMNYASREEHTAENLEADVVMAVDRLRAKLRCLHTLIVHAACLDNDESHNPCSYIPVVPKKKAINSNTRTSVAPQHNLRPQFDPPVRGVPSDHGPWQHVRR